MSWVGGRFENLSNASYPHGMWQTLIQLRNYYYFYRDSFLSTGQFVADGWIALSRGFPSQKVFVIAVIAEDERSDIASLIHHLMLEANRPIGAFTGKETRINNITAAIPSGVVTNRILQDFLFSVHKSGGQYAVIALSPEDLRRQIYHFINFDVMVLAGWKEKRAGFGELDFFLRYFSILSKKYGMRKTIIINRDVPSLRDFTVHGDYFEVSYGTNPSAVRSDTKDVWFRAPTAHEVTKDGNRFTIQGVAFTSPVLQPEIVSWMLAVTSLFEVVRIPLEKIVDGVADFGAKKGGFEYLSCGQRFDIVVQRTRTPEELHSFFMLAKSFQNEHKSEGLMLCVIGGRGNESEAVGQERGRIASEYCDRIFITVEDPYDASPENIINYVVRGLPRDILDRRTSVLFWLFPNRREAIRRAMNIARSQDTVAIPGKIADEEMVGPRNTRIPWNERGIIQDIIAEKMRG